MKVKQGTGGTRAQEKVEDIRAGQTIRKAGKHMAGSKRRHDKGENRLQNKTGN